MNMYGGLVDCGSTDRTLAQRLRPRPRPEPFLSTLQNMGVKFLQGVENFQQGEVLFVQAFVHAAKMHFVQL